MKNIALSLPDMTGGRPGIGTSNPIQGPPGLQFPAGTFNLGVFLTSAFDRVIFVAGFLMLFWMLWGIFQYIFAGGDKEALGKARSRITWAIVGFLLVVMAFAVSGYLQTIFPSKIQEKNGTVNEVPTPYPSPGQR